jgi:hypothetical protein
MWIEGIRVHANVFEHVLVEHDTGAEDEALTDHPAQRYPCKVVTGCVGNGTATNI